MEKLTPVLGWVGLAFGIATAVFACIPDAKLFLVSIACMLPGFLLSSLFILFKTRFQLDIKPFNPAYIAMLLSSAPLLLTIYFHLR